MNMHEQTNQIDHLEWVVATACRLAASGEEIKAFHIVTNWRPTYQELLRYRTRAEANGFTMTVLGAGGLVLRCRGQAVPTHAATDLTAAARTKPRSQQMPAAAVQQRAAFRGVDESGRRWLGALCAIKEGVR